MPAADRGRRIVATGGRDVNDDRHARRRAAPVNARRSLRGSSHSSLRGKSAQDAH
jgi:hypothetical protein